MKCREEEFGKPQIFLILRLIEHPNTFKIFVKHLMWIYAFFKTIKWYISLILLYYIRYIKLKFIHFIFILEMFANQVINFVI